MRSLGAICRTSAENSAPARDNASTHKHTLPLAWRAQKHTLSLAPIERIGAPCSNARVCAQRRARRGFVRYGVAVGRGPGWQRRPAASPRRSLPPEPHPSRFRQGPADLQGEQVRDVVLPRDLEQRAGKLRVQAAAAAARPISHSVVYWDTGPALSFRLLAAPHDRRPAAMTSCPSPPSHSPLLFQAAASPACIPCIRTCGPCARTSRRHPQPLLGARWSQRQNQGNSRASAVQTMPHRRWTAAGSAPAAGSKISTHARTRARARARARTHTRKHIPTPQKLARARARSLTHKKMARARTPVRIRCVVHHLMPEALPTASTCDRNDNHSYRQKGKKAGRQPDRQRERDGRRVG